MEATWTTNRLFTEIDHHTSEEITVRMHGILDALSSPSTRPLVDALVEGGTPVVNLDFTSLSRIDGSGVGVVVSLYRRLRGQGRELYLRGLCGEPLALFTMLNLDTLMTTGARATAQLPLRRAPLQSYAHAA